MRTDNAKHYLKKILCVFLSAITILTIAFGGNTLAFADDLTTTIWRKPDYKKVVEVPSYKFDERPTTNLGGMSAGTANNRLFVVKSVTNDKYEPYTETEGVLYYYSNIYNPSNVKHIRFTNSLLGHANSMAVDDNYIYVTMWQKKDGGEKTRILQINRKAISALPENKTISSAAYVHEGIKVCTRFYPKNPDGTKYETPISSITKYSYDSVNKKTTFIIGAGNYDNRRILIYKKAVLDHNTNVITVLDTTYYIKNTALDTGKGVTQQDIFYDKEYGLFIPEWHGSTGNRLDNSIMQVDLKRPTTPYTIQTGSNAGTVINVITPTYLHTLNSNDSSLTKFELESMAFIKKSSDKKSSAFRVLLTANIDDKDKKGCDAIVEIKSPSSNISKL